MTAPERSLQQRRDALAQANEVRIRRGKLKRDIKAGKIDVSKLIEDPPDWICSMKVVDLLMAQHRTGKIKAVHILNSCEASLAKTVEGLTARQRKELVVLLS